MRELLDLEFIKKWMDISEQELMERLVKDAIGLQKEAEEHQRQYFIKKRKTDPAYPEMVTRFLKTFEYLSQYFSKEEIINTCMNHMSISDLTEECYIRGYKTEDFAGMKFVKTIPRHKFIETKGSWQREVYDTASVFLISNHYQNVRGSHEVTEELLLSKKPWLKDYTYNIYDVDFRNDWIYVTILGQSLYCPFSAIMNNDAEAIYQCHKNYWHNYKRGKIDKEVEDFLNSPEVLEFFEKVRTQ